MRFALGEGLLAYVITLSFPSCSWYRTAPHPMVLASVSSLKGLVRSAKAKIGAEIHRPSTCQRLPGILLSTELSFLMSCIVARNLIIEGVINCGIYLNKASIVVFVPQEAPQFCNCDGNGPVLDSFDFMTTASEALLGNLMTPKSYTGFEELTLSGLQPQFGNLQS